MFLHLEICWEEAFHCHKVPPQLPPMTVAQLPPLSSPSLGCGYYRFPLTIVFLWSIYPQDQTSIAHNHRGDFSGVCRIEEFTVPCLCHLDPGRSEHSRQSVLQGESR